MDDREAKAYEYVIKLLVFVIQQSCLMECKNDCKSGNNQALCTV